MTTQEFNKTKAELDAKLEKLAAEYRALIDSAKGSDEQYKGYRAAKNNSFALAKLAHRGQMRKERNERGGAVANTFAKEGAAKREVLAPNEAPDIFSGSGQAKGVEVVIKNTNIAKIFDNVPDAPAPVLDEQEAPAPKAKKSKNA